MGERPDWQEAIARQRVRLEADLPSRQIGVGLSFLLFSAFLPLTITLAAYVLNLGTEIAQYYLMRRFADCPSRRCLVAITANSVFGIAAYSVPPVLLWQSDDPMAQFVAAMALIGALLNVSVMRAAYLPYGLLCGLPPALALLWMPLHHIFGPDPLPTAAIATAGVVVLMGYFASALVQNNRAQSAMAHALDRASDASRAKSRFLSAMSHEMRTPLNAILGISQLLREGEGAAVVRDQARVIEAAARKLQMLVEDVLDLASATEGQIRFRPVTATLRREIAQIAASGPVMPDVLARDSGSGGVRLTAEIAEAVPELGRFDPMLLRKSLTHLAAVVLAGQPDPRPSVLRLGADFVAGRDDSLRFTIEPVRDGDQPAPGMSEDGPDALRGTTDEALGLTLVHRIAAVIGGKATMTTGPDGRPGARLDMPFVMVPDPPASGAEGAYGRLKVLVVDDIATNRFVVVQLLKTLRIEAAEADSGAGALDRLAAGNFDLVLLDMNMPGMDGEATFRAIRAMPAPQGAIPVIAVTADATAEQRDRHLALGLNGHVPKPVDTRLLWAEILGALPPPPPL